MISEQNLIIASVLAIAALVFLLKFALYLKSIFKHCLTLFSLSMCIFALNMLTWIS